MTDIEIYGEHVAEWEQHILVVLFIIQQRWDYYINKELKDNITTKQWIMMAMIKNTFDHDPSMQEVADTLSTTHQNIKQLAIRLQEKGLLKMDRDQNNRRILRLKIAKTGHDYLKKASEDIKITISLFEGLNDREVKYLFKIMAKLEAISEELYQDIKISKIGKN